MICASRASIHEIYERADKTAPHEKALSLLDVFPLLLPLNTTAIVKCLGKTDDLQVFLK